MSETIYEKEKRLRKNYFLGCPGFTFGFRRLVLLQILFCFGEGVKSELLTMWLGKGMSLKPMKEKLFRMVSDGQNRKRNQ